MISCKECLERMYPEDPRVPVGRYHQSGCECYCDKPSYDRELEEKIEAREPTEVIHRYVHQYEKKQKLGSDVPI